MSVATSRTGQEQSTNLLDTLGQAWDRFFSPSDFSSLENNSSQYTSEEKSWYQQVNWANAAQMAPGVFLSRFGSKAVENVLLKALLQTEYKYLARLLPLFGGLVFTGIKDFYDSAILDRDINFWNSTKNFGFSTLLDGAKKLVGLNAVQMALGRASGLVGQALSFAFTSSWEGVQGFAQTLWEQKESRGQLWGTFSNSFSLAFTPDAIVQRLVCLGASGAADTTVSVAPRLATFASNQTSRLVDGTIQAAENATTWVSENPAKFAAAAAGTAISGVGILTGHPDLAALGMPFLAAAMGPELPKGTSKHQLDPTKVVVINGAQSLTTFGDSETSWAMAVNRPEGMARLAALHGMVQYDGNGRYTLNGEPITLPEIESRFGSDLRKVAGPRLLESGIIALRTRHAGLVPTAMRGAVDDGSTEAFLAFMGLTKPELRGRRNDEKAGALMNAAASEVNSAPFDTLYMAFAGARLMAGLGVPLHHIFPDSRSLGMYSGSGIPGANQFAELVLAGLRGDNRVSPRTLPHALQGGRLGVMGALMGPEGYVPAKGAAGFGQLPPLEELVRISGARTLGPNLQMSAECATFLGALAEAANRLTVRNPGQFRPAAFLVGAGEAPHGFRKGDIEVRMNALGFDGIGAMETWDSILRRGADADLWSGYAPFTTNPKGFWPGEGGAMALASTLPEAIGRRLPLGAILAGWGKFADEGKPNQTMIGYGGINALLEAIDMASYHGLRPGDVDHIDTHGTFTPDSNSMEPVLVAASLMARGLDLSRANPVTITAWKALLTHGLGAASGHELDMVLRGLQQGRAPGLFNTAGRTLDIPSEVAGWINSGPGPSTNALMAKFGFGGNNVAAWLRGIENNFEAHVAILGEYGYTRGQIEAYWSDLMAIREVANQWNDDLRWRTRNEADVFQWSRFV